MAPSSYYPATFAANGADGENVSSNKDEALTAVDVDSSNGGEASANHDNESDLDRIFTCDQCDKIFTRKHNLETHKLVHSQSKPYTCTICKSGFKRSHDLKRHQRMHTGEKPHLCNKCDRSFARADALLRHTKHGCSSSTGPAQAITFKLSTEDPGSKTTPELDQDTNSPIAKNLQEQNKRGYETVSWKPSQTNYSGNPASKNSGTYSSYSSNLVFDISNNQSSTRDSNILTEPSNSNYNTSSPQQLINGIEPQQAQNKISFLEHRITLLEKHIDNDQFRLRNLENRLLRLESTSILKETN